MYDFMISIKVPTHHSFTNHYALSDEVFIYLIDFDNLMDAKQLESPENVRRIFKTICPNSEEKYVEGKVYEVKDFLEEREKGKNDKDLYSKILLGCYIMKDENGKIRIISQEYLPMHSLLTRRIIKIPVYDNKEDLSSTIGSKESHSRINPFMYHKKIWGTMPYVRSMEHLSSMSIKEITESAILLNTTDIPDSDLGFLVEYHDCKLSTINFVDRFFNDTYGSRRYSSAIITGENKIYQVQSYNGTICLLDLKEVNVESVILE